MKKIILSLLVALMATTGATAQSPATSGITWNTGTNSGTFTMPAYDVEVNTELWYKLKEDADPTPSPSPTMGGESGGTLPAPVGEGLGAGSETSQLLRSTFGRLLRQELRKNHNKSRKPHWPSGFFCALLYAIILTSCSFSDK